MSDIAGVVAEHVLIAQLQADGASDEYLAQFERELSAIEDVLSGSAFAEFIEPYVPTFAPRVVR